MSLEMVMADMKLELWLKFSRRHNKKKDFVGEGSIGLFVNMLETLYNENQPNIHNILDVAVAKGKDGGIL
jgi:hypothetical protein